jgi:TatD DNase family protein
VYVDSPWCEVKATHASNQYVQTRFESKKKERYQKGAQVKGRNEPVNLVQILEIMAGVRGEDVDQLADQFNRNTQKLFNLD